MKELNHMVPTILMETHNMATKIEDEPLLWYIVNAVIDPDKGEVMQYNDLTKQIEK